MTIATVFQDTTTQDGLTVRALSSITSEQTEAVIRAVRAGNDAWEVRTAYDYDGYLSVSIEPRTLGTELPGYFVTGTKQHLELLKAHNDDLTPISIFEDIGDLSAELMGFIA